jgi:uncharacterized metal-binding protein YceD (DUF177 family)
MTPPEFSRPRRLDTIGESAASVHVEADVTERAALAARFDLIALDSLVADYALRRDLGGVVASGTLRAGVVQRCIATGEPVPATVDEPFELRFVPAPEDGGDEIELAADDLDTMFYEGSAIDLGEAAAETLSLALDPYPRSPGAEAALREAGVQTEEQAKPAGALAGLRDLLDRK